jgi:hypothetical protein
LSLIRQSSLAEAKGGVLQRSLLTGPSKVLFGLFAEHHLAKFAGISLTESGFESNSKNLKNVTH